MSETKYKRGDTNPADSKLFFLGYTSKGGEWWGTAKKLGELRASKTKWRKNNYRADVKESRKKAKEWYHSDLERSRAYQREYYHKNKEKKQQQQRRRKRELYQKDPLASIRCRLRTRFNSCLQRKKIPKTGEFGSMLGCEYPTLIAHLESKFTNGMTWDNRSDWHVDHITPLKSAQTEEEVRILFHYTNLQPLWARDNMIKGASWPPS